MLLFRSRFPGFSPYSRPGFPCHLSGSVYSAVCQFPFILPCFAPTAVPQVLTFFSLSTSLRCFALPPLSFVRFRFSISLLSLCFFFSLLPGSPSQWVLPGHLSAFPSAWCHASVSALVLSLPAFPFSALLLRITGATQLPASCFQLGRSP